MGVVIEEVLKSKQLTISQINSKAHNTWKTKLLELGNRHKEHTTIFGMDNQEHFNTLFFSASL